jgi:hypothetical protein
VARLARKQLGRDLAPLLAKSIVKVRERKAAERIWTDRELAAVHAQIEAELWRVAGSKPC